MTSQTHRPLTAALLLLSAFNAQATEDVQAESWECFSPLDFLQEEAIIKLTREFIPKGQTRSEGTLWANGLEYQTYFHISGLERQWLFGQEIDDDYSRHLFVIDQNSTGLYYDFSTSKPDDAVQPKDIYTCARHEETKASNLPTEKTEAKPASPAVARTEYIAQIKDKIERNWLRPPGTASGLKCVVRVSQILGGAVVQAVILTSSGNIAFDRSVKEAVLRSSPLPVPKDPWLFDHTILITFEPEG